MNRELASKKCANHWQREAVARCPECGRFFCRECITEHEDRILCAACLKSLILRSGRKSRSTIHLFRGFQMLVSIFILWLVFYYLGRALLLMPDEFHEGTLWGDSDR
jgi:hypothetical protein